MVARPVWSTPVRWLPSRTIADWVRQHVEYHYGTTDAKTSAFDTATERIGVCRDLAHLVIAFCRAPGIPARYASCYAPELEPPIFIVLCKST